jgi:hypothetical protein
MTGGGGTSNEIPKATLRKGQTDRLVFQGDHSGLSIRLTYAGYNWSACTGNDRSYNSPAGSRCDIGAGWQPDAHLTFVNR